MTPIPLCCRAMATAASVLCAISAANAADLWVQNNGSDSGSCGALATPCRTITRAIANASAGSTIWVGPGRYGVRAELPEPSEAESISIKKTLRLFSTHGAAVTTIQAPDDASKPAVTIDANAVTFGAAGRGFTVSGLRGDVKSGFAGTGIAVRATNATNGRLDVRIQGNTLRGLQTAIRVDRYALRLAIVDNDVVANDFGIDVRNRAVPSNTTYGPINVSRNLVLGNIVGMNIEARDAYLNRNVGSANDTAIRGRGTGFFIDDGTFVANNGVAVQAVYASPNPPPAAPAIADSFSGNTIVGNLSPGIDVASGLLGNFRGNNLFGNDTGSTDNCALSNLSPPAYRLDARDNYWGSAAGPGPDPADDAGASGTRCAVAPTQVMPFAIEAFPVAP
jgi:hypothetical protein